VHIYVQKESTANMSEPREPLEFESNEDQPEVQHEVRYEVENQPQDAPPSETRHLALLAWQHCEPDSKVSAVRALHAALQVGETRLDPAGRVTAALGERPGRPSRPELVSPGGLARRGPKSREGRAAMLHAIAHIEFNAINLALDAIWRFDALPEAFYIDWLSVAVEEAHHFSLLAQRLIDLGSYYGEYPAHNGLWDMTQRTADDVLARMALVPRTLEARGLDASPAIRGKFLQAGDTVSADILDLILRDEIGHVAIGNHWYRWLCERAGIDHRLAYRDLSRRYQAPRLKGPFNFEARRAAGFDEDELAELIASAETRV
jgi:uncharacterized ferritin-like protein (DUF455 family)